MIKTLHRTKTDRGSVRLIERNSTHPYVVILDVAGEHVGFDTFTNYAGAIATFTTLSSKLDQSPAPIQVMIQIPMARPGKVEAGEPGNRHGRVDDRSQQPPFHHLEGLGLLLRAPSE